MGKVSIYRLRGSSCESENWSLSRETIFSYVGRESTVFCPHSASHSPIHLPGLQPLHKCEWLPSAKHCFGCWGHKEEWDKVLT